MLVSRRFRLDRLKMLGLLNELEAADAKAVTLCLPLGLSSPDIENLLEKAPVPQDAAADIAGLAVASPTGAILFWGSSRRCLILPPFPITEKYVASGYDVESLRSLLKRSFGIALILVRLGAYAIGICQGEKLIVSKTGTGLVHGRHKKGGSSQRRFERHREKQAYYFLERVCGHAQQQLEPYASTLDYLVYGGSRTAILSLRKQCRFLLQFDNRTLPPLLNIPQPRRIVLEAAIGDIWSSSVTEWHDSELRSIDRQETGV